MFYGSPGTGKTLLAKAITNELTQKMKTNVTFIYRKGSDCHSLYFGQSSENLRKIFETAEKFKPCVLFFDEIDGLCPSRGSGEHEHNTSVVTTFLGMMDAIKPGEIFVIGATNRLDSVDPALRRPGRFDKELMFHPPDELARLNILKIHTKDWKAKSPSNELYGELAAATRGFTGASLANLCAQSVTCAIQRYKTVNKLEEITGQQLKKVAILKEDWFKALRLMGRPKTDVFGSVIYSPQSELSIKPLISEMVQGIKNKILKLAPFGQNSISLQSFLIYGPDAIASRFIVPELLNTKEFQNIPAFQMTEANIGTYYFSGVQNIIAQVMAFTKPCILYIPQCEKFFSAISEQKDGEIYFSFLISKLTLTTSRPVLILGTSSCAPSNFPEEIRHIFSILKPEISYKLRLPTEVERRIFFSAVLNKEVYGGRGTAKSKKKLEKFFQQKLDACVKKTEYDPIEYLVQFHSTLQSTGDRYMSDEDWLINELTLVIDNYRIK